MRRSARFGVAAGVALAVATVATAVWVRAPLPVSMTNRQAMQGVAIEDRNGLRLRSTRAADGSQARWVPLRDIDIDIINAFVAVEDRRFWEHRGIDIRGAARAARDNLRARRVVSGASTITMQLARLMRGTERDWGGKLTQALWALRIEHAMRKQDILEQYLNRVELGQATVGVEAASALYFDASASDVSVGQAATLAGLAHAPSRENPYASPRRARARRDAVLERMRRLGYATREDVSRAHGEPLVAPRRTPPFLAPHFTARVLAWLEDDRGLHANLSRARTSLDLPLQGAIEAEVRHTVDVLRDRGVEHAAAVVLDNETGEILAWVGSPDFWSPDDGQTDMVISPRQPGSALKPFLYGLAFDRGFTAASVLPDIPKAYATATGAYSPRNYDRRFRGPVRAREALASSYNVPAVELAARVGTGSLLHTLHLAGFGSLDRDAEHYGLGLALGNGDVALIELANGYRALANGGQWHPWTWRATTRTRAGRDAESRRIFSATSSAIVLDILSDPAARIPGFGTSTPFDFPFPVAVKTGTSRHFTDNWAIGVTRRFTVAVWAGNFSGRPMQGVSGVTGAGPLLHRAVLVTAQRIPPEALTTPGEVGAVRESVCRLSGLRATATCASLDEWFAPGTAPTRPDDWERGGIVVLPDEYAGWNRDGLRAAADGVTLPTAREGSRLSPLPNADTARTGDARFRLVSPMDGDRYAIPAGVDTRYATIPLRASGEGAAHVQWSVDGEAYTSQRWPLALGRHVVRAVSARGDTLQARIVVER